MATDLDWEKDKERFVSRLSGRGSANVRQVADDRTGLWSPLVQHFADLGRDLFAASSIAEVLRGVVTVAVRVVPGTELAGIALRVSDGRIWTPASTARSLTSLDQWQESCGEGPFELATRQGGTGMAMSADLANELTWPGFAPGAVEQGVRSVLSAGVFPSGRRSGALSLYSSQPRGLAAADPDVVLILASYAATALSASTAETDAELAAADPGIPLRSTDVVAVASDVLLEKRYLPPEDVYDVLRRACTHLLDSWRG